MGGRINYLVRISAVLCISAGLMACGTSNKSIDESDAVVSLDHPRFVNASGDFTITRDGFTGQATHSSAYQAVDSAAHLLVLSAGTREYIEDIKEPDDVNHWCERTFFDQSDEESTTRIQSPLWRNSGSVEASFGKALYRRFLVGNRDCVCFVHGWGTRSGRAGDRSYRAGSTKLMLGYVCDESQRLARTDIASLIKAIDLKKR